MNIPVWEEKLCIIWASWIQILLILCRFMESVEMLMEAKGANKTFA